MSGLAPYDILVIALIGIMTFRGGYKGMFSQLISIASWGIAWFLASRYSPLILPHLPITGPLKNTVAIALTFVLAMLALRLITRFFQGAIRKTVFHEFDRQLGALLGLLKGFIICLVITFCAVLGNNETRAVVTGSPSGRFMVRAIATIQRYLPESENHEKVRQILQQFNATVTAEGVNIEPFATEVESVKEKLAGLLKQRQSGLDGTELLAGTPPQQNALSPRLPNPLNANIEWPPTRTTSATTVGGSSSTPEIRFSLSTGGASNSVPPASIAPPPF